MHNQPSVYSIELCILGKALLRGFLKAGGGVMRTLEKQAQRGSRNELARRLEKWMGFTPHAIASHPRVTKATREKLLSASGALQND